MCRGTSREKKPPSHAKCLQTTFPKYPLAQGAGSESLRALMVSCQGNKSTTWAGGVHTCAGPSQHPDGELFLPFHAFLGSKPLTGAGNRPRCYCQHLVHPLLFPSPVSVFLLVFCLEADFPKEQVCLSLQVISDLAILIQIPCTAEVLRVPWEIVT